MSHSERREAIERARQLLANAREGTRRLVAGAGGETSSSSGVSPNRLMTLIGVCAECLRREDARELYDSGAEPFTAEVKGRRAALDVHEGGYSMRTVRSLLCKRRWSSRQPTPTATQTNDGPQHTLQSEVTVILTTSFTEACPSTI